VAWKADGLPARPLSGERTLVFATLHGTGKTEDFLSILQLTGANRADRSKLGSRFVLKTQSDVIYAAVFHALESKEKPTLEQEDLISRFHMIVTEWSNEYANSGCTAYLASGFRKREGGQ
jgi:hypothetical protein